jgi:serralysin
MTDLTATATTTAAAIAHPSFLDTINWGTQLTDTTINVYFATAGEVFDGKTSVGWNDYEIQQAMLAFQQFANVCNVTFNIVTDQSQATLTLVDKANAPGGTLGYFNPPGTNNAGVGVMIQGGYGWDEDKPGTGGLEQGGYGFITMIHEFGHALGMAHPHDGGGTSSVWEGVTGPFDSYGSFDLNQGIYTVMSYNDGWNLHPSGENTAKNYGWEGSMMGFDVAMLQQLYGANMAYATGDDTYVLPDDNQSGTFFSCIWDAGGADEITYGGTRNITIDLRPASLDYAEGSGGFISYADGIYGGFTIAHGVVIEGASGGSGNDDIIGNNARNKLGGNDGRDVIFGLDGKDRILGGTGDDNLSGGDAADRMNGGLGADTFVYLNLSESGSSKGSYDEIRGFTSGTDSIDLGAIDAKSGGTANDAFIWIDSDGFNNVQGELRWKAVTGGVLVQGDYDGDGVADFKILLSDASAVVVGDFVL